MKVAKIYKAYDIGVEDVPIPTVGPDDALIKIKVYTICGSDLHAYRTPPSPGPRPPYSHNIFPTSIVPPFVPGHEFAGDVVQIGENIKSIKVGDRVTGFQVFAFGCGKCYWCGRGIHFRCPNVEKVSGTAAEYIKMPHADRAVFKLPEELSYEQGSLVEPLAVAVAANTLAKPNIAEDVVVLGAGPIGLFAMQVFKNRGCRVIATEVSRKRLNIAEELGVDAVINPLDEDPTKKVMELTNNIGADFTVDCAGINATVQQAIDMVRSGGKVILTASYRSTFPLNMASMRWISLLGEMYGEGMGSYSMNDVEQSIFLIQKGLVKTDQIISHRFPLDHVKEAFETGLDSEKSVKVLINL